MPYLQPNLNRLEFEKFQRMGELAYADSCKRMAFDWVREHPARFAVISLKRFFYYWNGVPRATSSLAPVDFRTSAFPIRPSKVRAVFGGTHRSGLPHQSHRNSGLCVLRRAQHQGRANPDPASGHAAVYPCFELSAAGHGGGGSAFSCQTTGGGTRVHPFDLHRAGLEYDFQRLFFDQKRTRRNAGGCAGLPAELVAEEIRRETRG